MNQRILFLYVGLLAVQPAMAHPHVFVDAVAHFAFGDSTLNAVKVVWQFDEIFSIGLLEDYDQNENDTLEKGEEKQIFETAFSSISKLGYFTKIALNDEHIGVTRVDNFHAFVRERIYVCYSFSIPFNAEVKGDKAELTILFRDPTNYIAIHLDKDRIRREAGKGIKDRISFSQKAYYDCVVLSLGRTEAQGK